MLKKRFFIVYCSPAGTTEHVANTIEQELGLLHADVTVLNLGEQDEWLDSIKSLGDAGSNACLFIGSPVYRDMAVPPVMKFIEMLPKVKGAAAAPFVTWGAACSGVALWQMGKALREKGFALAAAAKVTAVHSMMWDSETPAGQGHPNAEDDKTIHGLAGGVFEKISRTEFTALPLETLDYQPEILKHEMKAKLSEPWTILPKNVDEKSCTQCGICRDECPTNAIELNPFPEFNTNCFDCFNCIRLCPEGAVHPPISMEQIWAHIRNRVETINELPPTEIYI